MKPIKKILNLFTHTDLDGVSCAVLAELYAHQSFDSFTYRCCDYHEINARIDQLLDVLDYKNNEVEYTEILITDISVNEETAKRIDDYMKKNPDVVFRMLDHHQISDEVKSYDWVHVDTTVGVSGTSLLYDYIYSKENMKESFDDPDIKEFVCDVSYYDNWLFNKNEDNNPENLNLLLKLLGAEDFMWKMIEWIVHKPHGGICVKEHFTEYSFIEQEKRFRLKYSAIREQNKIVTSYKGYSVAVVFAENHISFVGDYVLTKNPEIDFCAIISLPKTVSLRTQKEDINLGLDIAKPLGGGGHPKAAGFPIRCGLNDFINSILQEKNPPEGKTYVCADLHFSHKNIIKYEKRPFKDIEDMNTQLVSRWNETVSQEDTVYILGDVSFASTTTTKNLVSSLNGKKILILGNHDLSRSKSKWKEIGFDEVYDELSILSKNPFDGISNITIKMTHCPPEQTDEKDTFYLYGHVHGSPDFPDYTKNTACVSLERLNYRPALLKDVLSGKVYS